jgi:Zn-dependent peptidase ImmA (M78 family)
MACSCRTGALRIFARSLAQVNAPTAQYARPTRLADRPRLSNRNFSIAPNYRRDHAAAEPSDVAVEGAEGQRMHSEDHAKLQTEQPLQSSSQISESAEDDRLFSIKLKPKNAKRRANRSSLRSGSSQPLESQGPSEAEPAKTQKPRETVEEQTGQSKKSKPLREKKREWTGKRPKRVEHQAITVKDSEEERDERPEWLIQKQALKKKFPEGWRPPKRLSPDALDGIRVLHQQFPDLYTTAALAQKFEVSPEAIRRILKSKWQPTAEEEEGRQKRWFNRGMSVWQRYAELGKHPPRRWREAGVQASPWEPSRREKHVEEEDAAHKIDSETATRLQAQARLSKSLV